MKKTKLNSESGVSILEVLIVLVIGAILISVTVAQFGNSKVQLQRQNIAREFKNNLERCRFDSVRRRAVDINNMSRIVILSQTKYEVWLDSNSDGIIESGEVRTVDFTGRSEAKLLVSSTSLPITVRFNQRGHITTDSAGTSVFPLFTICSGICTMATTVTPENSNVISISPTGTVAMLYGGDVIPPLAAPSVTPVANTASVSLMMTVAPSTTSNTNTNSGGTNPTPTPLPTATPDPEANFTPTPTPTATPVNPTPTPTPVSTPTPSATPIPTPTPTPPPVLPSCTLNQKPGNPASCNCDAGRSVRTNGKCQ